VFLGLIISGLGLQHWLWPLSFPLPHPFSRVAGVALAACGVALVLSARLWFLRTGQHPAPWRPSPELLIRGVYRYTRNPMYLGITLFQFGLGVALSNPWIASLAPLSLAIVHFLAVRPEEAYLSERFGERYLQYLTTTRRYL
jgi:protein-S-isoprenylcysteine O-methyltransferase Ste14